MRTWPKTRPSPPASSTQAAKALRAAAASVASGRSSCIALDNLRLPAAFGLAGAGDDEVGHRGVGADGSPVKDPLSSKAGHLAREAQVFGNPRAGGPAICDKNGDQDHVVCVRVLDNTPYLGLLIQKANPDLVVKAALPDRS